MYVDLHECPFLKVLEVNGFISGCCYQLRRSSIW